MESCCVLLLLLFRDQCKSTEYSITLYSLMSLFRFIEFDISTNGQCTSDSLVLDQTINGSVSTTMPIVEG